MWSPPKLDWKSTDYYNIEDWQRVRSNLEHLYNWLQELRSAEPILRQTDGGRGIDELPYVQFVNNLEKNLEGLQKALLSTVPEDFEPKIWYERLDIQYRGNPTSEDWNRWETILQHVYNMIQYIDTYVFLPISGTCRCGSERTLIRFSRGR